MGVSNFIRLHPARPSLPPAGQNGQFAVKNSEARSDAIWERREQAAPMTKFMKALRKHLLFSLACIMALYLAPRLHAASPAVSNSGRLLRDASLMLLKEGNARFASGKSQHPNQEAARRTSTFTDGQEPFATILACSDSRDPVELLFDRGVGDLFVVRVAGNIAGESEMATVEYGVGHLNTPLLIVMGHTKCGAVTAVVKGAKLHGHLHALAEKIRPAAEKAKAEATSPDETVSKAIQANVWQTIEDLIRESPIVREKLSAGQVHIQGAVYDLEQGKVNWLGAHPGQDALVALASQGETDATQPHLNGHETAPAKSPASRLTSTPAKKTTETADTDDSHEAQGHTAPPAKKAAPAKPH